MPRPTKLTPKLRGDICELIEQGNFVETAVRACGIAASTHYSWMERGELDGKEHAPHRAYRRAIEEACAKREAAAVNLLRTAAKSDWRAAAWLLERSSAERWARRPGSASPLTFPPAGGAEQTEGGLVDDQVGPDGQPL